MGCKWFPIDDAYELVVVRKDKHPSMQGFFYTFPEMEEYSNRDLYKPHPTLPDHWIYYGRADNIIVFSNGEKLNPATIEETLQDHPAVNGALVVGANRFQPALLLEPVASLQDEKEKRNFIDSIWPLVEKANRETVAHGRIGPEFISVSNPNKPFARTGKGTIQRGRTTKLYADEIDQLYEKAEKVSYDRQVQLDVGSEESLVESITEILDLHIHAANIDPDTNFFSAGVDSLQVMNLSRLLRAGLKSSGYDTDATQLAPRNVYNNPTPRRLSQYILYSIVRKQRDVGVPGDEEKHEIQVMKDLHRKYTQDLNKGSAERLDNFDENQTILLTGSTGTLGSYLLDQLVRNPAIKKVICLNRALDGGITQQAKAMEDRGLAQDYATKAEFHHFNVSQPHLGVSDEIYTRLLRQVDRIIHNAWPVNYNITTETFEPHLHGVRSIADLASQSAKRVAVIFISSISTAEKWDTSLGPVPEERLEDWSLPSNGYGRSKMVGSLILEDGARAGGFSAAVIRVGQIAGPEAEKGVWARQEWLPSIIASSLHLSALPHELGLANRVDWIPVERIARLVLDVSIAGSDKPRTQIGSPIATIEYFHGVNPCATSWGDLAVAIQEFYEGRIEELAGFKEWVDRLETSQSVTGTTRMDDAKAVDAYANPGLKLLDTYRAMSHAQDAQPVVFDLSRTSGRSAAMKDLKAITPELMVHWCKQWGF